MVDNTLTVEKVFAGRLLQVPDYQRGYAWDEENWLDFLDDLDLLPRGRQHFTGTLVLHRHPPDSGPGRVEDRAGATYDRYDIVDGQQRLTTVVLLLDAIQRELAQRPDYKDLAAGIEAGYVKGLAHNGQPLYKLELGPTVNGYWKDAILNPPGQAGPRTASEQRLLNARDFFARYLASERANRGDEFLPWLHELQGRIKTGLLFVLYEVTSSAEVGVIFEVMNDRGKRLTELEKTKNYLLYLSDKLDARDLTDHVNKAWARIFEELMAADLSDPSNEDQLMRAHWLAVYNADRRTWDGTASVKKLLSLKTYRDDLDHLLAAAMDYVTSLRDSAIHYRDVLAPKPATAFSTIVNPADRRAMTDATRRLLRVGAVAAFLPLLMAVRLRFPDDARFYVEVADLCEKFGFRVYRLGGRYSNSGQTSLFSVAHDLMTGKETKAGAVARVEGLVRYYSPAAAYALALQPGQRDDWYHWSGVKQFLYAWEEHLSGPRPPEVPWELLEGRDKERSIEHVLPQTPEAGDQWMELFTDDQRDSLTNNLGNLVLTEDNSFYGRKKFSDKKARWGRSGPTACRPAVTQTHALHKRRLWQHSLTGRRRAFLIERPRCSTGRPVAGRFPMRPQSRHRLRRSRRMNSLRRRMSSANAGRRTCDSMRRQKAG